MRIGIVYYSDFPRNRGVLQLASALQKAGHEPFILARKPSDQERVSSYLGVPVIQVPREGSNVIFTAPIPLNPYWYRMIVRLGRKFNWEAVFVRETPLSLPALLAARHLGIPAFLDMRENLAAMYEKGEHNRGIIGRLVRRRWFVQSYESFVVPEFDYVFTVTEDLKSWVLKKYCTRQENISVLGNYPRNKYIEQAKYERTNSGTYSKSYKMDDRLELVHAGYVSKDRGVQDIIRSIKELEEEGYKNIHISVIGEGKPPEYTEVLSNLSERIGVEDRVSFHDYPPPGELANTLVSYDIGVSSNRLSELVHQTTPGKLWEYMAVGLPILSSARRPVMRVIEKENCGRVYNSREPKEIANQIRSFIDSPVETRRMGKRAANAIEERYNESINVNTLKKVINKKENNRHGLA